MAWVLPVTLLLCVIGGAKIAEAADVAHSTSQSSLNQITQIVENEIKIGNLHGAVVVVGIKGSIVYRQAFGNRAVVPQQEEMTVDTIFDIASLTKVVATTTAIMQLSEAGKLDLHRLVANYWPAFANNGKSTITIADLLTHYSSLPPDLPTTIRYAGYEAAMRAIEETEPTKTAGSNFVYSDIDFAVLGELVRLVSGQPLDAYCARHIFSPLQMRRTGFLPPASMMSRIAPTDFEDGQLIRGQVQDPMARRMGGVSGHAGLFSTVDDLSRFAQMLLNGGAFHGRRILSRDSVKIMTNVQSPLGQASLRGFGWDIDSPYSTTLAPSFSTSSFGHTGYTGTALWIDPTSSTFLIILTNRLHPDGQGSARSLQRRIATLVGAISYSGRVPHKIQTGIDVLESYDFRQLRGHRVALLSNATGRDSRGHRTADILRATKGIELVALLSPEHGFGSNLNQAIPSTKDKVSGLPIYSLYGENLRPTDDMLKGVDTIVIDLQDIGARFYTYATTMAYVLEAAATRDIDVYVLDRPNPISADVVQGPMLDSDLVSFTGYMPMPVRHGMTIGELALMFNEENHIGANLHVIAMRRYDRRFWYDETGLTWISPSPNIRNLNEAALYPGVAMTEGANVSVGRGTETPFSLVGAPYVNNLTFINELRRFNIPGIALTPAEFTPQSDIFSGRLCQGVRISIVDRAAVNSPLLGIALISALQKSFPNEYKIDDTLKMVGSHRSLDQIKSGADPLDVSRQWDNEIAVFLHQRESYLLYGSAQ